MTSLSVPERTWPHDASAPASYPNRAGVNSEAKLTFW